jgi:ATP-dependent DNA helicase RecG
LINKFIPSCFQDKDKDKVETLLKELTEPKSAKELASAISLSTRTIKDKYLDKMLKVGVIVMTIPDKPQSSKQKYKLILEQ